jgi:hypothetical protein
MTTDDEAARQGRAEKLRKQISRLKHQDEAEEEDAGLPQAEDSQTEKPSAKSPRDFIHERMRELDEEKP